MDQDFINPVKQRGIALDIILGNHDVSNKNTNEINAQRVLFGDSKNINYYVNPEYVTIGGKRILFLPWICNENKQQSIEMVRESKADYVFGHLELSGFEMHRGHFSDTGLGSDLFSKYKHVFTGHYHHRSTVGNITYIGSPYQMTWSDYQDPKYFMILDLDTGDVEWVENPYTLFNRIVYDESDKRTFTIDFNQYKNTYIKVVVENKLKQKLFESFIDKLQQVDPIDMQVIDKTVIIENPTITLDIDQIEDTLSILTKYVNNITMQVDKQLVNSALIALYNEANQIEKSD